MVIPDIVKDAFSDVPKLPASERPLICVTPRWMPEENFSDSASVAQIQLDAILAAGGIPIMMPLTEDPEVIAQFVEMCDGFCLTGGHDVDPRNWGEEPRDLNRLCPIRDALEFELVKQVLAADKPLLAICRGLQLLNVVLGGTLVQDLHTMEPTENHTFWTHSANLYHPAHAVHVQKDSLLYNALGKVEDIQANSYHDEALRKVSSELTVVAYASDGIIEGAEVKGKRFAIGVQWHPEYGWNYSKADCELWKSFVTASQASRSSR